MPLFCIVGIFCIAWHDAKQIVSTFYIRSLYNVRWLCKLLQLDEKHSQGVQLLALVDKHIVEHRKQRKKKANATQQQQQSTSSSLQPQPQPQPVVHAAAAAAPLTSKLSIGNFFKSAPNLDDLIVAQAPESAEQQQQAKPNRRSRRFSDDILPIESFLSKCIYIFTHCILLA